MLPSLNLGFLVREIIFGEPPRPIRRLGSSLDRLFWGYVCMLEQQQQQQQQHQQQQEEEEEQQLRRRRRRRRGRRRRRRKKRRRIFPPTVAVFCGFLVVVRMRGSCKVSVNAVAFFGQGAKGMCLYIISTRWKRYEAKGQGVQACPEKTSKKATNSNRVLCSEKRSSRTVGAARNLLHFDLIWT